MLAVLFGIKCQKKCSRSQIMPKKVLALSVRAPPHCFLPCSTGFLISRVSKFSDFSEGKEQLGGGCCVCVWGGGWKRTSGLFVKSFLPAFRKKQHRNIFSNHTGRLAKFGWILTYLKISVEMAVTWSLPGAIQFPVKFGMKNYICRLSNVRNDLLESIPTHPPPGLFLFGG